MVKKTRVICICFLFLLSALCLTGCGSSSSSTSSNHSGILEPASTEFPNAGLLVSADSVQKILGNKKVVIIDARSSGYSASHIPGAINLKYGDYFNAGSGLLPVSDLESKLSAAGLSKDMTFVIYDNTTASFGAAGRVFWMLEYLGCNGVHILNGGWDKWIADGRSTETVINTRPQNTFIAAVNNDIRATSSHILKRLTALDATNSNDDFAIVDARTNEEYIGWQFYGEKRGGHIPKAVNIPYEWFFSNDKTVLNYQDLRKIFEDRGVTPDKEVASYCTAGIRSGYVYFLLRLMGYQRASNYDGSILEWNADSSLPMSKLPQYQMIVNSAWVYDLISGKNPQTFPGHGYVILELVSSNQSDPISRYNAGHIPGALHLNIRSFNKGYPEPEQCTIDFGKMLYGADLQKKIEDLGITKDTTVVLYEYWDATWCARIAWALLYAGVTDVRILNGAWDSWVKGGYPIETQSNTPQHKSFGAVVPVHPEYRCEISEVKAMMSDPSSILADTRSWDEYIGLITGYPDEPCWPETWTGRIPGAVWVHDWDWYFHWKDANALSEDEGNNSLRSYTEVEKMFKETGFTPDKKMASYCGGGYRASLPFIYAYMMGYTKMCNYDGSMYEWFFGPNNPIATGYPSNSSQFNGEISSFHLMKLITKQSHCAK